MLWVYVKQEQVIFAGIFALAIHGIGMMGKLIYEVADNVDKDTLDASEAFGMGRFAKIRYIILTRNKTNSYNYVYV
jgi:ABC-type phosphate/phosphonate transport system permease subunit